MPSFWKSKVDIEARDDMRGLLKLKINMGLVAKAGGSVATAPAQSQLKPEAEPSLAEAQPEPLSDGSHILANSSSG